MSDLVQIARSRIDNTQRTHWEGCERDHRECLIQRMADEIEALREVAARMVAGIDHLDKLAREWEPDHSSGADRRGWLLAQDARDDAVRALGPNAEVTGLGRNRSSDD